MPDSVFGIPTELILLTVFLLMVWNSFKGSHNKFISSISSLSFAYTLLLPYFLGFDHIKDAATLKWSWFICLLIFLITSVIWLLADSVPMVVKIGKSLKQRLRGN